MTDFTHLQHLGPLAPIGLPPSSAMAAYLDHYRLTPLLAEDVALHAGFIEARGFRLWAQVWSPPDPQGTIFVVHGYFDHLGLYRHLLELVLARGWRVVMWDLPGHGLSSGARASIDDFDDYVSCLSVLTEEVARLDVADAPWIGIGQSTGAAILATDALTQGHRTHWAGLALLAPLVRPWGWQQSSWLHRVVSPFVRSVPRRFRANTTDLGFADFLRSGDPLQPDRLALTWVSAMRDWIPLLLSMPPSDLPVLILQGEQDLTVDWQWNLDTLLGKFPNAEIHRHPDARHHLVNEAQSIRDTLFEELAAFLARYERQAGTSRGTSADACSRESP
ncbi:alpha/beta hydrolase [Chromohalobacter israelensis]|uniref:alpha/beta hydrolase n=1 Tax=Chromohalobacter israelensis TaxID=141390 RepID=UPI0015C46BA6|nr:alpha/beta hydrolase [Chromohalobacter salexigens]NWO55168.1 alpha/beta hydrolase [Chromohalobacter salexigens]